MSSDKLQFLFSEIHYHQRMPAVITVTLEWSVFSKGQNTKVKLLLVLQLLKLGYNVQNDVLILFIPLHLEHSDEYNELDNFGSYDHHLLILWPASQTFIKFNGPFCSGLIVRIQFSTYICKSQPAKMDWPAPWKSSIATHWRTER